MYCWKDVKFQHTKILFNIHTTTLFQQPSINLPSIFPSVCQHTYTSVIQQLYLKLMENLWKRIGFVGQLFSRESFIDENDQQFDITLCLLKKLISHST